VSVSSPDILVGDDEAEIRDLLRISFETKGFAARVVCNGREVLREMERQVPQLIVLDIDMPELDGYHFLDHMRANAEWRNIPVIIISGLTKDSKKTEEWWARELGVDAFFAKPFNPLKVIEKANDLLRR